MGRLPLGTSKWGDCNGVSLSGVIVGSIPEWGDC